MRPAAASSTIGYPQELQDDKPDKKTIYAGEKLTLPMWAYTHEDDVIDAHVQAVLRPEAADPGSHEPYIIAAPDTRFKEDTLQLLASQMGLHAIPEHSPMLGNASPLSCRKAMERL